MSKSRTGKIPNQSAQPAAGQNVIIPGKFMESDWCDLLETEDGEDYIASIIDEISDAAGTQVFEKIIQSRVQPHTVLAVRELLLEFVEWQFLQSDPGEKNTNELSWIEDEEPTECAIDNWAQGAVPVSRSSDLCNSKSISVESCVELIQETSSKPVTDGSGKAVMSNDENKINLIEDNILEDFDEDRLANIGKPSLINDGASQNEKEDTSETAGAVRGKEGANNNPMSSAQLKKKCTKKLWPYEGSLPKFQTISLESVTDERPRPGTRVLKQSPLSYNTTLSSDLLVRNRYGRASGPKEVVYNEQGAVVKVQKLNVANFPKHIVPVKFAIVDSEKDNDKLRFKSAFAKKKKERSRTTSDEKKIDAKHLVQRVHPLSCWPHYSNATLEKKTLNTKPFQQYSLEQRSPLPPLMVDAMDVTDGVTIREGGLSKQVIKKAPIQMRGEKRSVQPLSSCTNRLLDVKDIVPQCSPSFGYLHSSETVAGI